MADLRKEEHEAITIDEIPDTLPTPEELVERRVLQQTIQSAIQSLPQTYRSIVLRHDGEQLTFSPDWTNPPHAKSTVKTRYNRAKLLLRGALTA